MLGFSVGAFWLFMVFAFFTVPGSTLLSVVKVVAAVTCPPLMADIYFTAPILNAAMYGAAAFAWSKGVGR